MPRYFYKAKNLKGKEESGVLEAQDQRHLTKLLRQKGYFLVSAETKRRSGEKFEISVPDFFYKLFPVSLTEKLFFTKNLEVMVRTGVPLPRAFDILSQQAKATRFKKALSKISEKIVKGEGFSEALGAYPDIFSSLYQETVKVGEETGNLEESLRVLSNQMEREHDLKSKVKTAMLYPMIVLCMALGLGVFMLFFAVPKLEAAFEELGIELPFTTQAIIGVADFLTARWPIAVGIIFVLIFVIFFALRSGKGGKIKSGLILKIPVVSRIVKQTNSALVLRTLSSLLEAGVPIVRSLNVASGALANVYFKESLRDSAKLVEKGEKLSKALQPYENLYAPMVLQMLEIGEETGETSQVLEKLADFYEAEVTAATQKLSSVIEPFLIMAIGGIVGFFAVSMMQPMFSVMGGM